MTTATTDDFTAPDEYPWEADDVCRVIRTFLAAITTDRYTKGVFADHLGELGAILPSISGTKAPLGTMVARARICADHAARMAALAEPILTTDPTPNLAVDSAEFQARFSARNAIGLARHSAEHAAQSAEGEGHECYEMWASFAARDAAGCGHAVSLAVPDQAATVRRLCLECLDAMLRSEPKP